MGLIVRCRRYLGEGIAYYCTVLHNVNIHACEVVLALTDDVGMGVRYKEHDIARPLCC